MAKRRRRHRRKKYVQRIITFSSNLPKVRRANKRRAKSGQAKKLNNDGFIQANEPTPFDEVSTSKQESEIVQDMMLRYLSSDEKRYRTMLENKFVSSLNEYNKIMAIYQSPIYQMLKETGYSDSHQIRDLVQSFGSNISSTDLEYALISLMDELKLQQTYNIQQIKDAMDLGFSFEDAIFLTESDRVNEIKPEESLLEVRDRLEALLETRQIRYELEQELRAERW